MSELGERRWGVISERGREATGLAHAEAAQLARALASERVRGLCVVTDRAARHLPPAAPHDDTAPSSTPREASPAAR